MEKQVVVRLENFKASVEKEKKEHFKFLFPLHNELGEMKKDLDTYYEIEKQKFEMKKAIFEAKKEEKLKKLEMRHKK